MIVKRIHRFWGGPDMPDRYREYGEEWQRLNPGWFLCEWTWDTVARSLRKRSQDVLDDLERRDGGRGTVEFFVQYADLIGYELVREYGGVYINCDIEPVRPLNHLATIDPSWSEKNWATYENTTDGRIVNAAIGAPEQPDSRAFWAYVIHRAVTAYWENPSAEMVETTGPATLTRAFHDWNDRHVPEDQVAVYPVDTFNPVHWSEIEQGSDASTWVTTGNFPEATIGVHHWGHRECGRTNTIPA